MYISEIDDILDQTLDKLLYSWIIEENIKELVSFSKIIKDTNFVKHQQAINSVIEYAQELISEDAINKIVSKHSNIVLIKNVVSKYIGYYIFLLIGINYGGKIEQFNNNLVELSRAHDSSKLKIDNFFNTESNSNIIKTTSLAKEFTEFIKQYATKKDMSILSKYSSQLKTFVDSLGQEPVDNFSQLSSNASATSATATDKYVFQHNVIKIIIYLTLYKTSEKKEIFNIIETTETSNGEFIFIDVVVPKSDFIDYTIIESILEPHELKTDLPETIYELINEDYSENINEARKYFTDFDLKIQKLLDTHIIIPIVDDFLLYHKDNEKYENIRDKDVGKHKQDTKIKYVINKINNASDYYKNPTENKKLFYVPLQDRNAVLTNTFEDIKIISKMKNIIKMNNENLDLLNDLISYRMYPYISFKDFKTNGFVFNSDNTKDAFRNASFANISKNKFNVMQTRIISDNMLVNIVGFAIINNDSEMSCMSTSSFHDVCEDSDNPLQAMKVLLEHKINQTNSKNVKPLEKNYYWLFDLEKQKYSVPYYDISPSMNPNDVVKILCAYLYDWTMECVIKNIKSRIESIPVSQTQTKTQPKIITKYIDYFTNAKKKYPDITNSQYSHSVNELEYLIYYMKGNNNFDTYDINEDNFTGLYGDVYKLPIMSKKPPPPIPSINIKPDFVVQDDSFNEANVTSSYELEQLKTYKDIDETEEDHDTNEYINGICQHQITWEKISESKRNQNVRFTDLIYEFIQQYVQMNPNQDSICKSCKSSINIKKYILDGTFDNATQSYVTFYIQLDINLEEMPEYEKFKTSIKSLDKIVDKLSSIVNFQGLTGISYSSRSKRKNIIKNTLDTILVHNNYLKKSSYTTTRDKFTKIFGINKNISNLYVFELENSIFMYSSKSKDFYKFLKINNVMSIIIILMILEITDTQILSLSNDKICGYFIYKKIGHTLFESMNIIVNKSQDVAPIKDYPILCYLIYLFSCFVTKYNLWADTLSTETNVIDKKKNFLMIQKSVIATVVEIFNTILQVDAEEMKLQKIYLYEQLHNKYYYKINVFKEPLLVDKLDKMYLSISDTRNFQNKISSGTKYDVAPSKSIFNDYVYDDIHDKYSKKFCLKRLVCPFMTDKMKEPKTISNITNCPDGRFHNFSVKGNELVCELCSQIANPNIYDKKSEYVLGEQYVIQYLKKIAKKYCKTGQMHQFEYDSKVDENICKNCKYKQGSPIEYAEKELFKLYDIVESNIKANNLKFSKSIENMQKLTETQIGEITSIFNKIVYKYQKNNDVTTTISKFLDIVQKLLGTDIIIDNQSYNLYYNNYVIDHDFNGVRLETPIIVSEKEHKFRTIEAHPHFKRNVIVYTMHKKTKYELFYDTEEKILLGYREINKEYITSQSHKAKLKINFSFKNMLLLYGFTRQEISLKDFYPEIYGMSQDKIISKFKYFDTSAFVNKIATRRFELVKKLGMELKKYINRFKNAYKIDPITIEATFINDKHQQVTNVYISESANNPLDLLYMKFLKKNESKITTEGDDKKVFLKHMNVLNTYLAFENVKLSSTDFEKFTGYVDSHTVFKHDFTSNMILNYVVEEVMRLLDYNSSKNIKTHLINFVLNLIHCMFEQTFYEISKSKIELSHFYQSLYSSEFYLETQTTEFMMDTLDYYSTQEDVDNLENMTDEQKEQLENEIIDDIEESQAFDMEDEIDIEGVFELYGGNNGYTGSE